MKSPGGGKALLIEANGQRPVSPFPRDQYDGFLERVLSLGANSVDEAAAELGSRMKAKPPTSFKRR